MSREIKFRAWIEDTFRGTGELTGDTWMECDIQNDVNFRRYLKRPIMQFTGLLDKNGKEIYENDIVEVRGFLGDFVGRFTVEYKLNSFSYYAPGKPETALYYAQNLTEVIGNVWENPELLTV